MDLGASVVGSSSTPTSRSGIWVPGFRFPSGHDAAPVPVGHVQSSHTADAPYPQDHAAGAVPDPRDERGRGPFLVSHLAATFEVTARRGGGSRVTARLPVRRGPSRSIDPGPPMSGALRLLEEADGDGGFGREPVLRALVIQLSQAVEHSCGPDAGEGVVAQVGSSAGGQMEAAYRVATQLAGRLTPEQLAGCFVRLKDAIGGRFTVVEITQERIVLANTRCPSATRCASPPRCAG